VFARLLSSVAGLGETSAIVQGTVLRDVGVGTLSR
jgi:hypothetical protein